MFADRECVKEAVNGLHVGNVAAEADNCASVEDAQALDICEAGEGAVGGCVEGVSGCCSVLGKCQW